MVYICLLYDAYYTLLEYGIENQTPIYNLALYISHAFLHISFTCLQRTPLFRACEYNNLETAKVLLKNNAKVIVHNEKLNGLDVAVEGGHKYVPVSSNMMYCQNYLHPSCD